MSKLIIVTNFSFTSIPMGVSFYIRPLEEGEFETAVAGSNEVMVYGHRGLSEYYRDIVKDKFDLSEREVDLGVLPEEGGAIVFSEDGEGYVCSTGFSDPVFMLGKFRHDEPISGGYFVYGGSGGTYIKLEKEGITHYRH